MILTTEGLYCILKLYIKNLKSNLQALVVVVLVREIFKNSFVYCDGEKINSYYEFFIKERLIFWIIVPNEKSLFSN